MAQEKEQHNLVHQDASDKHQPHSGLAHPSLPLSLTHTCSCTYSTKLNILCFWKNDFLHCFGLSCIMPQKTGSKDTKKKGNKKQNKIHDDGHEKTFSEKW